MTQSSNAPDTVSLLFTADCVGNIRLGDRFSAKLGNFSGQCPKVLALSGRQSMYILKRGENADEQGRLWGCRGLGFALPFFSRPLPLPPSRSLKRQLDSI